MAYESAMIQLESKKQSYSPEPVPKAALVQLSLF